MNFETCCDQRHATDTVQTLYAIAILVPCRTYDDCSKRVPVVAAVFVITAADQQRNLELELDVNRVWISFGLGLFFFCSVASAAATNTSARMASDV